MKSIWMAATVILSCGLAIAAEIRVPGDFQTIQAAVDAASDGDTVLVDAGIYKGQGNSDIYVGKSISLIAPQGPHLTVIDGENARRGIDFLASSGSTIRLTGFGFRNCCYELPGAVVCDENADVHISNCEFIDCRRHGSLEGGGIRLWRATATLENITIRRCESGSGGGILVTENSHVDIMNCTVQECDGGGIIISGGCDVTILDSVIEDNLASDGSYTAGIGCIENSDLVVKRCYVRNNINNYSAAGGVFVDGSTFVLENDVFYGNEGALKGSVAVFRAGASGDIIYSTFWNNNRGEGVASLFDAATVDINSCIFWNENADKELEIIPGATVTTVYCDIRGGAPGVGNIALDPEFSEDTPCHLTETSPCRDAGIATGGVTDDIDGDHRPEGYGFDMGADEYYPPPDLSVTLEMPSHFYHAGDDCFLKLTIQNRAETLEGVPVFCVLSAFDAFYFWPQWTETVDYELMDIPVETTALDILPLFQWPAGTGSADGLAFYGAITDDAFTALLCELASFDFGWMTD